MLNEERVKMMIKLASYEEGQGKEDFKVNSYYRNCHIDLDDDWVWIGSRIIFSCESGEDF